MLAPLMLVAALVHLPAPVRGDFDHDGKPDIAEVVRAGPGRYQLIIRRGALGHPISVIATFDGRGIPNLYVTTAKPGRWKTWCGKGGGSDDEPCAHAWVTLRGDTLDFGWEEASESVAIWTGERFEVVLLSD